ncbi:MAG TPA: hypothetical protein VLX56_02765 [Nitrososphaerales archaeon]|nr:hypothetical protein [Nitrososphaerales archaeon]
MSGQVPRGYALNARALAMIYRSPKYVVLSLAAAVVYYYLFAYFVSLENYGIVIYSEPAYMVYLLAVTASVLLTVTVYSLSLRLRRGIQTSSPGGFLASVTTVVGGCMAGCACQAPILYNLLYFFGLNAFEASGVVTTLVSYDFEINLALIVLNIVVAYRLLSKMTRIGGRRTTPPASAG